MRLAALASLFAIVFALSATAAAQTDGALRIAGAAPYDRVVPGQILELRVEGFGERFTSPPEDGSLRVLLTQDGATQTLAVRTATQTFVREGSVSAAAAAAGAVVPAGDAPAGMKAFQAIGFVVPRGLHAGEAEVVVSYRKQRSAPFKLNIVERPLRPVVGGASIVTIAPASITPPPPRRGEPGPNPGLRLERGAKGVELHVRPLFDPEDPEAGVLVRFMQGGAVYDADARIVHRERKVETTSERGLRFSPARDVVEVDVPDTLSTGEAEMEVRLRAAGQTGDAATVHVTITDAERSYESPAAAAPRALSVTPRRVGVGQALMVSVDRRRALEPDPSKAVVVFESMDGAWSFKAKPEMNGAVRGPDRGPEAPVLLVVRVPKEMTGAVRVRVVNPARAEYEGGVSEPAQIEVVAEAVAPEVLDVAEASASELAQLRQITAAQEQAGINARQYDPTRRYVSIRANGLDYNPRFLRVKMEQDGRGSFTLGPGDFPLFSNGSVVVRVPKEIVPGAVRVTVENRGANGYSAPAVKTFELPARP
ncbi:MAG TPA: hypothetical protein VJ866_06140 [Pyrinomonadaceae bacterium]|nr:hypothetical protein [Pyrinomonadaceae bacterium]